MITFDQEKNIFHLKNEQISYVIGIEKNKYLTHRYFGSSLPFYQGSNAIQEIDRGFATNPIEDDRTFSLNSLPMETSTQGTGDHRIPNYQIRSSNGSNVTNFYYKSFNIRKGKPSLTGLPSLREGSEEVSTLEITLFDAVQQLEMVMVYSIYENYPVITRNVRFTNKGKYPVYLENAGSMLVDLPKNNFDLITLNGSHTNEAIIHRQSLHPGIQKIGSTRGTSSPQHQPFIALVEPTTTEFTGEVYSFHFVYSGNFIAQVESEQYGTSRVQMGIHPDTFEWELSSLETFQTPEAILTYTRHGMNSMSQTYHNIYQQLLVSPNFTNKERPILLNTWEANYFELSEEKLLQQADKAHEAGIELFVVDDGWFGQRNSDSSSLGDWYVNPEKFPHGIEAFADAIHEREMKFGLWFEPEMVSKNSELYKKHPDWVLQVPNYPNTEGRKQLVLDLSREDVQEYIIHSLSKFLRTNKIDYIKWDMNRHLTEVGSKQFTKNQQKEISHRYVLGLYHILERLTQQFPECLFENCSSGGGRFDPGMTYYMPQTWTSDNTDALSRSLIQYGYSYIYPPIMMGAHVSPVPNRQVGRISPLNTRGLIAMSGNLGYEIDLTALSEKELRDIKNQIVFYKKYRNLLQFGEFYRLQEANEFYASAWLFKSNNKAIIIYFNGLARPAVPVQYLKTRYLDSSAVYQDSVTKECFSGAELNNAGIAIPRIKGDFETLYFIFEKVE